MRTQVFGSSVTPSRGWCTVIITMPGVNRTGNGIFGSCARARRPSSPASGASAAARWGRCGDPRRSGNSRNENFAPLACPWRRAPAWPSGGEVPVCPRGDGRLARGVVVAGGGYRPGSRPCWFVPTGQDPAPIRLERSGDKRPAHLGSPQTYPPSLWISAAAPCRDRPRRCSVTSHRQRPRRLALVVMRVQRRSGVTLSGNDITAPSPRGLAPPGDTVTNTQVPPRSSGRMVAIRLFRSLSPDIGPPRQSDRRWAPQAE
jgi:hypothetical protein